MDKGQALQYQRRRLTLVQQVSGGGSEQVAERNIYDVLEAHAAGESLLGREIK